MSKNKTPKGIDEESIPLYLAVANNKKIAVAHSEACEAQSDFYIDPVTGDQVMTSYFLKNRGYCCKNNCRHCPYDKLKETK